jgi:hypothetical protein
VNHLVLWIEFCIVLCGNHIPAVLMRCKQQDFLELQQGSHNVYEYSKIFNNLVQYGVLHVDTNGNKAELFWKGLSAQL